MKLKKQKLNLKEITVSILSKDHTPKKSIPGREDGGPVTRSRNHPVDELIKVDGTQKRWKHQAKINLITDAQLKDPAQTFEILIKKSCIR